MKDDVFNMDIRKFLKIVGVTSQREIEHAVEAAVRGGKIKGTEKLQAKMTLSIEKIGLTHVVDGEIALE